MLHNQIIVVLLTEHNTMVETKTIYGPSLVASKK